SRHGRQPVVDGPRFADSLGCVLKQRGDGVGPAWAGWHVLETGSYGRRQRLRSGRVAAQRLRGIAGRLGVTPIARWRLYPGLARERPYAVGPDNPDPVKHEALRATLHGSVVHGHRIAKSCLRNQRHDTVVE